MRPSRSDISPFWDGPCICGCGPNAIGVRTVRAVQPQPNSSHGTAPRVPHTKAYEKYILLQLVHATIEDVSIKEGLGAKAIEGIVERWISREVQWGEVKRVKILGLDEIALKKGHRDFVVIVTGKSASDEVKVLAVLPDRKKQTVKQFLETMPRRVKRAIRTVCTDMYEGFILAVKEVLGKAQVVIDRYHVAKLYRAGADRLRTQELRRLKQELPKEDYAKLKGAMWPFRKKAADLEVEEQELLTRLFTYTPALQQAYEYREQLTSIFDAPLVQRRGNPTAHRLATAGESQWAELLRPLLCKRSRSGKRRSPITFWHGTTVALWKGSTTRSRCSSGAATASLTSPISSNGSFWILKGTSALHTPQDETTICGISHGKYQRAKKFHTVAHLCCSACTEGAEQSAIHRVFIDVEPDRRHMLLAS